MRTGIEERLRQRKEELKTLSQGAGYTAIRASHNLKELNKISYNEQLKAFEEWEDNGSIK